MKATGYIGARLFVLIYTMPSKFIRVVSLRKANPREVKSYAET